MVIVVCLFVCWCCCCRCCCFVLFVVCLCLFVFLVFVIVLLVYMTVCLIFSSWIFKSSQKTHLNHPSQGSSDIILTSVNHIELPQDPHKKGRRLQP